MKRTVVRRASTAANFSDRMADVNSHSLHPDPVFAARMVLLRCMYNSSYGKVHMGLYVSYGKYLVPYVLRLRLRICSLERIVL